MTEEQTQLLIEEQRRTNALLENLIAVLTASGTGSPKNLVPERTQLSKRKSNANKAKALAKELLIKEYPQLAQYAFFKKHFA